MNKPKIRFKGFEGEWEKKMIGSLGTTYSGLSGKTKEDFGQGNAQYVTFLNVLTNAQIDSSILEKVNVNEKQNAVLKNDILFNTSSETPEEVGLCSTMQDDIENVYLNSFCFGFRPSSKNIDSNYLVYLMRSNVGRSIMKILAQGATRYNLSKNKLCETNISTPSLPEQQAIAEYFKQLDAVIGLTEKKVASLKQVKQASLQQMFPQEGETTPRIRFKGFSGEWEKVTIKNVCIHQHSTISQNKLGDFNGSYPIFGASGFIKNVPFFVQDKEYIGVVKDGAGVGRMNLYPAKSSILGTMHYLLAKDEYNISFLYNLLQRLDLTIFATGSTIPHIYFKDYSDLNILVPSLDEQTQIANYFSNLDKQIALHEARLEKLKSVKASCLDLMFV